MESEVIAALIGAPAVLVTAAAAWAAGRTQSRGAYHGPVDAVRRTSQREAYADLYRSARRFLHAWENANAAVDSVTALHRVPHPQRGERDEPLPPDVQAMVDEMHEAQDSLEHAVDMVRLEGPESIAVFADRIWDSAVRLGGRRPGGRWGRAKPLFSVYLKSMSELGEKDQAMSELSDARRKLLPAARSYLNGGPPGWPDR
jgi:hypothetical protein